MHDIVRYAASGQLRSWADHLVVGETRWSGGVIPAKFWEEFRFREDQDWIRGRFQIDVAGRFVVQARGVSFYLDDLKMLFANSFNPKRVPTVSVEPLQAPTQMVSTPKGGRKPSASWPQWVAELVAYIHDTGVPEGEGTSGVDVILSAVAERLAERGLEGPSRSTTQDTMRAVLLRLRGAGN